MIVSKQRPDAIRLSNDQLQAIVQSNYEENHLTLWYNVLLLDNRIN